MSQKRIDRDKIIHSFIMLAFAKSAGAVSLADIANDLDVKKPSLYNHFSSRDEMYTESIVFCAKYLENISFTANIETLAQTAPAHFTDNFSSSKTNQTAIDDAAKNNTIDIFSKLIFQYFRSHTLEPLLQVYSFIHSEKYFNETASITVENTKIKITEDIQNILSAKNLPENFYKIETTNCEFISQLFATSILQSLDSYILQRKDSIRKNPEQVSGSLFELPFEENIQQKLIIELAKIIRTL